jgi:hypothetical protein
VGQECLSTAEQERLGAAEEEHNEYGDTPIRGVMRSNAALAQRQQGERMKKSAGGRIDTHGPP